ncbi:Ubiquitin carboxyl-terminal hydrolase 16 [Fulvia fulva]|nr:Ubiquitin carboxyl-terminal hydrolase 16 [Fulvia fulva]WPV17536.1 Ubiquitin carboxyl-terminal hydrolase 16 [Fulvia fulva]WPV31864.1 Ubiquitin carboxyl-terminal hydrolase 16 [Fulvia fulva]
MPDKPLTIATYAAGASLAAITLVYVFGPTFFLDDDAANSSKSSRKKGVVGLVNPANDCFINSVLQVLAGLPELRTYLIREVHRRDLDGPQLYEDLRPALEEPRKSPDSKPLQEWQIIGLQQGLVTAGLKEVLNALNERPIYKKTISAQSFIRCVEQAFRTRISRTQQDAQEFLQVIVQRLAEEYHAGKRARKYARQHGGTVQQGAMGNKGSPAGDENHRIPNGRPRDSKMIPPEADADRGYQESHTAKADAGQQQEEDDQEQDENIFPLEGKQETQVECSHCHFKPKPTVTSFNTLPLNVPHDSTSSTLNQCFDGLLRVEHIDGYTCDRCRLEHALQVYDKQISRTSGDEKAELEADRAKIEQALHEDPEVPHKDVQLPDTKMVPKRRITKHSRISSFPQILSIHLNRSVWDNHSSSSKNMAKVSFPETLPLGSLLDRKTYRLLGVVTHKGGHNSGHYESFRRQILNPPYSTPASLGNGGVYSIRSSPAPSPRMSAVPSPQLSGTKMRESISATESPSLSTDSHFLSTPTSATPSISSGSSTLQPPVLDRRKQQPPPESVPTPGLPTPPQASQPEAPPAEEKARPKSQPALQALRNRGPKRKGNERWWRISDDKIKESKTSDVLGMQREVYMLFYELVPNE